MQKGKKRTGFFRLIIILNRIVIGGQAIDTIPLAWHLQEDFDILVIHGEKDNDEVAPELLLRHYPGLRLKKIRLLKKRSNVLFDLLAFLHIWFVITSFRPHIVHSHGGKSGLMGRLAAWINRVPVIVHTFHGHFFHSYFSANVSRAVILLEKWIGKITDAAIVLSESQKDDIVHRYGVLPGAKINIIPLGLSIDRHPGAAGLRASFRGRYGLSPDEVAIGIVGRIVPVKNHPFFIQVVRQLMLFPPSNPVAFFIIGDGDQKKEVCTALHQSGISFNTRAISKNNRVVLTSWLQTDEIMNGLDIVVLTSLNEGTPLSLIEAQFFEKPVVATNVGGVKDSMIDGVTGFLSNTGDLAGFTQKVSMLVNDSRLRGEMGEKGYNFVSTTFAKEFQIEATRKLFHALLTKKGYR